MVFLCVEPNLSAPNWEPIKRLASLDHAASPYVILYEDSNSSPTVTTGHTYASLLDPDTLVSAHCYLQVEVKGAGRPSRMTGSSDE